MRTFLSVHAGPAGIQDIQDIEAQIERARPGQVVAVSWGPQAKPLVADVACRGTQARQAVRRTTWDNVRRAGRPSSTVKNLARTVGVIRNSLQLNRFKCLDMGSRDLVWVTHMALYTEPQKVGSDVPVSEPIRCL